MTVTEVGKGRVGNTIQGVRYGGSCNTAWSDPWFSGEKPKISSKGYHPGEGDAQRQAQDRELVYGSVKRHEDPK